MAATIVALIVIGPTACGSGNTGAVNCGPSTLPAGPGVVFPEARGISNAGDAWMLLPEFPLPSGGTIEAYFKLTGAATEAVAVRVEGVGFEPPGTVEGVVLHTTPGWDRAGREWAIRFRVPRGGCWSIRFDSPPVQGSFTLRVK
jgi:hypothetical protein